MKTRRMIGMLAGLLVVVAVGLCLQSPEPRDARNPLSRSLVATLPGSALKAGEQSGMTSAKERETSKPPEPATADPSMPRDVPSSRVADTGGAGAPGHSESMAVTSAVEQWTREAEDVHGTEQLRQAVGEAFLELNVKGELDEISCRETLCRMNLTFENAEEANRFQANAGNPERRRHLELRPSTAGLGVDLIVSR